MEWIKNDDNWTKGKATSKELGNNSLGKTSSQEDTQNEQEAWQVGPDSIYGPYMIEDQTI